MPLTTQHAGRDRAVLLALLGLALFANPALSWWLDSSPPWYLPYLLWLAVIALAAWQARASRRGKQHDER